MTTEGHCRRSAALAAAGMLAAALAGCGGAATDGPAEAPAPGWLGELPRRAVAAAPGERVWAVVPEAGSEAAEVATYRLESAAGSEVALVDDLGRRFAGVPGALVHPFSAFPEAEPAPGAAVLADRWDARGVVGRLAAAEGGAARVTHDWNGATVTGRMDAAMPLPAAGEGLVLRWVAYRPRAAPEAPWHRGLCFAEGGGRAWIRDDGGFVEVVASDAVRRLDDLGEERAPGARVQAYSWAHGYRAGVVEEVLEPGLRYAVKLADGSTRPFFFADLTAAL